MFWKRSSTDLYNSDVRRSVAWALLDFRICTIHAFQYDFLKKGKFGLQNLGKMLQIISMEKYSIKIKACKNTAD